MDKRFNDFIIASAEDAIIGIDLEKKIVTWNRGAENLFGYSSGEAEGRPLALITDPDREYELQFILDHIKQGRNVPSFRSSFKHKDSKTIRLSITASPILGDNNDLAGISLICRDVSAQEEKEQRLRASEENFRLFFEFNPNYCYMISPDGNLLDINRAALKRLEYGKEELIGESIEKIYAPECRANMRVCLQRWTRDEKIENEEVTIITKRGLRRTVLLSVASVKDTEGNIQHAMSVQQDITELKERERELHKLSQAIRQSPISIIITDYDGRIEYVNPQFEQLTSYSEEETIGKNPRVLKSGKHSKEYYRKMWQTIKQGETWRGEFINLKKNGETYYEDAVIAPVVNEEGEITHFIALKEDVTRRKQLEKLKEEVDRIMRHDLKTPLNAILGFPQLLKMKEDLDQESLEYIEEIEKAGREMLRQINQSLDLYKMETKTYQYSPSNFDLMKVISRIIHETIPIRDKTGIAIEVTADGTKIAGESGFIIYGEEWLTYSMLSNLIVNAIEASPEQETVGIELSDVSRDSRYSIAISNKGTVPKSIRNKFFEKYVTTGKKKGTGLGTYIARQMAETMGGTISMHTSETEGTTITIRLPKESK
jgi:PAS domain S-box-containing protein